MRPVNLSKVLPKQQIINDIALYAKFRKVDTRAHFNYLLLKLFWNIGASVNLLTQKKSVDEIDVVIDSFSKLISANFGNLFDLGSIKLMQLFNKECDETFCNNIAPYIGWEYLIPLLESTSIVNWDYYLRITIKEQLSAKELEEKILFDELNKQSKADSKYLNLPLLNLTLNVGDYPNSLVTNFFNSENCKIYKKIFFDSVPSNFAFAVDTSPVVKILYEMTVVNVSYLQKLASPYSNLRFTLSLFEIGDKIIKCISGLTEKNKKDFLRKTTAVLEKEVGSFFSVGIVKEIIKTAAFFTKYEERKAFAANLRWEHVVALMSVRDQNMRNYFGQVAITYNLNGTALKNNITESQLYLSNNKPPNQFIKIPLTGKIFHDGEVYGNLLTSNLLENKDFLLLQNK